MTTESRDTSNSPQPTDYHSSRAQRRAERRAARQAGGAWVGGLVLIGLGAIFLLQNAGALYLQNWWALFILIPALASFGAAYAEYRAGGRLNARARGSVIAGLVFTALAAVFLFNLNFSLVLPAVLILAGVGLLINTVLPN
jgi:hypothetical protein